MTGEAPAELRHRWGLWRAGIGCGLINTFRPLGTYQRIQTLRLLLCPVDFWRYYEFGAVIEAYNGGRRVLDLGSPKLMSRYFATRFSARVHMLEIAPTLAGESKVYRRGIGPAAPSAVRADGQVLPIADNSMDFAYSVSVIEHMGGVGDRHALQELARVVRPGGRIVVTVPVAKDYGEIWHDQDAYGAQPRDDAGRVFFARVYDQSALQARLLDAAPLRLVQRRFYTAPDTAWYQWYHDTVDRPRTAQAVAVKLFDMAWASGKIRLANGLPTVYDEQGVAALVFEKAGPG